MTKLLVGKKRYDVICDEKTCDQRCEYWVTEWNGECRLFDVGLAHTQGMVFRRCDECLKAEQRTRKKKQNSGQ